MSRRFEDTMDRIATEIAQTKQCQSNAAEVKQMIQAGANWHALAEEERVNADRIIQMMEQTGYREITAKTVVSKQQIMKITRQVCQQHAHAASEGAEMNVDREHEPESDGLEDLGLN